MQHPMTRLIAELAEGIPGYGLARLRQDLAEESPDLVTYKQAACEFSLSHGTIKNWVCQGRLKKYGTARVVRVDRNELRRITGAK